MVHYVIGQRARVTTALCDGARPEGVTVSELSLYTGVSRWTALRLLHRLEASGDMYRDGTRAADGRGRPATIWRTAPDGEG
jgi:predicted ArsR family transcriptional regulator